MSSLRLALKLSMEATPSGENESKKLKRKRTDSEVSDSKPPLPTSGVKATKMSDASPARGPNENGNTSICGNRRSRTMSTTSDVDEDKSKSASNVSNNTNAPNKRSKTTIDVNSDGGSGNGKQRSTGALSAADEDMVESEEQAAVSKMETPISVPKKQKLSAEVVSSSEESDVHNLKASKKAVSADKDNELNEEAKTSKSRKACNGLEEEIETENESKTSEDCSGVDNVLPTMKEGTAEGAPSKRKKKGSRNILLEEARAFSGDNEASLGPEESAEPVASGSAGVFSPRTHTPRNAAVVAKTKLSVKASWSSSVDATSDKKNVQDEQRSPVGTGGRWGNRNVGAGRGRGGRVAAGRGRGRGGGRWAGHIKASVLAAMGDKVEEEEDGVGWVQCDKCNKWRTLPQNVSSDNLPDNWDCTMNTWDSNLNCDVAEEEDTNDVAEKELESEEVTQRRGREDGDPKYSTKRQYNRRVGAVGGAPIAGKGRGGAGSAVEATNWIECSKCQKWRVVAPDIDSDALPSDWYCSMNTWASKYAFCDAPEEVVAVPIAAETDLGADLHSGQASRGGRGGGRWGGRGRGYRRESGDTPVAVSTALLGIEDREAPHTGLIVETRWVQCERKNCGKWRKVPPFVDMSVFPELWYCEMNTWDLDRAACDNDEESASEAEDDKQGGIGSPQTGSANQTGPPTSPSGTTTIYSTSADMVNSTLPVTGSASGKGNSAQRRAGTVNSQLIASNSKGLNTLSYRRLLFTTDGKLRPAYTEKNKSGYGMFSFTGTKQSPCVSGGGERKGVRGSDTLTEPYRKIGYWSSSMYSLDGNSTNSYMPVCDEEGEYSPNGSVTCKYPTILLDTACRITNGFVGRQCKGVSRQYKALQAIKKRDQEVDYSMTLFDKMKLECAVIRSVLLQCYGMNQAGSGVIHRVKYSTLNKGTSGKPMHSSRGRKKGKRVFKKKQSGYSSGEGESSEECNSSDDEDDGEAEENGKVSVTSTVDDSDNAHDANTDSVQLTVVHTTPRAAELIDFLHPKYPNSVSLSMLKHLLSISRFQYDLQLEYCRLGLCDNDTALFYCLRILEQRCEVDITVNKIHTKTKGMESESSTASLSNKGDKMQSLKDKVLGSKTEAMTEVNEIFVTPLTFSIGRFNYMQSENGTGCVVNADERQYGKFADDYVARFPHSFEQMVRENTLNRSRFNQYPTDVVTTGDSVAHTSLYPDSKSEVYCDNKSTSLLPLKMRKYK